MDNTESRIKAIQEERNILKSTISVHTKRINDLNAELKQIESKKTKPITISDHAMLRYLTRIYKLDVEALRSEILNREDFKSVEILGGNGKIKLSDLTFVLQDYNIVTLYENK